MSQTLSIQLQFASDSFEALAIMQTQHRIAAAMADAVSIAGVACDKQGVIQWHASREKGITRVEARVPLLHLVNSAWHTFECVMRTHCLDIGQEFNGVMLMKVETIQVVSNYVRVQEGFGGSRVYFPLRFESAGLGAGRVVQGMQHARALWRDFVSKTPAVLVPAAHGEGPSTKVSFGSTVELPTSTELLVHASCLTTMYKLQCAQVKQQVAQVFEPLISTGDAFLMEPVVRRQSTQSQVVRDTFLFGDPLLQQTLGAFVR